jgi:hypothetical protein
LLLLFSFTGFVGSISLWLRTEERTMLRYLVSVLVIIFTLFYTYTIDIIVRGIMYTK